ncbi:Wzy polymerase domain-containing protein [Agarivorans sp. MS3-6]
MLAKLTIERCFIALFAALLLLGMHYFQHNQGGTGLSLPFNLLVWCIAGPIIGLGLFKVSASKTLRYNRSLLVVAIGTALLWLPILYPNAVLAWFAVSRLIGMTAGLLLIFTVIQLQLTRQQWQSIFYLIIAGIVIESLYGLIQIYLLSENNWLGFNTLSTRASGIFQQANVYGTFLLFSLPCAVWLISQQAVRSTLQRTLVYGGCFFAMWAVVLSDSRTAFWALTLVIPLCIPLLIKQAAKKEMAALGLAIATGIAIPLAIQFTSDWQARGGALGGSADLRVNMLKVTWQLISQQPILGWGYGSFEIAYHQTQAAMGSSGLIDGFMFNLTHPHNELLFWLTEGGILPFIALLAVSGYLLISLFSRKGNLSYGCLYLAILLPCLFHNMTELPFYHAAILWVLFCILLGKISTETQELKTIHLTVISAFKVSGAVITVASLTFMLTGLQAIQHLTRFERTGSSNVALLESIVNPLPILGRYQFNVMSYRLSAALTLGLKEELENYLSWSDSLIQRETRTEHYLNRIIALKALAMNKQAKESYVIALWLFPDTERVSFRYLSSLSRGEQALKQYVDWNREQLSTRPKLNLYVHQINALVSLGEIKQAKHLQKEAITLFPNEPRLAKIIHLASAH